jgi:hypothetical protein
MADWMIKYDLFSHHVRWMVQIPRLYEVAFLYYPNILALQENKDHKFFSRYD